MSTHDDFRTDQQMAEKEERDKEALEALSAKAEELAEQASETFAADLEEEPEVEDPMTFTGSAAPRRITAGHHVHSVAGSTTGGGLFGPGGISTSPPFAPSTYPSTTTTPGWGTTLPPIPPSKAKSKKNRHVKLPPRFTEKVLLAFIDEDDEDSATNVVWAAHLLPVAVELNSESGEMELVIRFSMEDRYDNNPED